MTPQRKREIKKLKDYFCRAEQDMAGMSLKNMGGQTDISREDYMYAAGAYRTCREIAKILRIKYSFLYFGEHEIDRGLKNKGKLV